jgi:hypothetical protein
LLACTSCVPPSSLLALLAIVSVLLAACALLYCAYDLGWADANLIPWGIYWC